MNKNIYYIMHVNRLNEKMLIALAHEEIGLIAVKDFYDKEICKEIKQYFLDNIKYYINAPSIGRIGMAFYETAHRDDLLKDYYKNSIQHINNIRNAFHPYLSPIDKIRLYLQEIWPKGANLENIHDRKMFIGLCRVVESNTNVLPHQDKLSKDAQYIETTVALQAQFAANTYIDIPENGGELDIWREEFSDKKYDAMRENGSYDIKRDKLPAPYLTYKPEQSELLLFNARKLHAVKPVYGSSRLSISCFIGFYGNDKPLTYWS